MGKQVNFFLHPDDQADFEIMLRSQGDIAVLPYYHYDNKVSVIQITLIQDIKPEERRVYLVRKNELDKIELTYIEKFGYYLIDDNSPVVHYDRCMFDSNKIRLGRLYLNQLTVKNGQSFYKPEDFINWAEKLLNKTRRSLKKYYFDTGGWGFSEYVGKNTKLWLDKTQNELGILSAELIRN